MGEVYKIDTAARELLGLSPRSSLIGKSAVDAISMEEEIGKKLSDAKHPIKKALRPLPAPVPFPLSRSRYP